MSDYSIVNKPEMLTVGICCRTSNVEGAAMKDIPMLWERFFAEGIIEKIPNKTSTEVYALYCDYEGDHTNPYSVVIGCTVSSVDQIPEGLVVKEVPGGSFAKYQAIGEHPKTLIDTWGKIWQADLPRTFTGDYEVYGPKSPEEIEVFIAVEN